MDRIVIISRRYCKVRIVNISGIALTKIYCRDEYLSWMALNFSRNSERDRNTTLLILSSHTV